MYWVIWQNALRIQTSPKRADEFQNKLGWFWKSIKTDILVL